MKRAEHFHGLEINFGKLLLIYFVRPPGLKALGVIRSLGACGRGAIYPLPPIWAALLACFIPNYLLFFNGSALLKILTTKPRSFDARKMFWELIFHHQLQD